MSQSCPGSPESSVEATSQGLIFSILLQIIVIDLEYPSGLCLLPLAQWNPGQWEATQEMALLAGILLPSLSLAKVSSLSQ